MSGDGQDAAAEANPGAARPAGRRLADRILTAVHAACDQGELDTAEQLLGVLEALLRRRQQLPDPQRRRSIEALVAAHERLWQLRHPGGAGR